MHHIGKGITKLNKVPSKLKLVLKKSTQKLIELDDNFGLTRLYHAFTQGIEPYFTMDFAGGGGLPQVMRFRNKSLYSGCHSVNVNPYYEITRNFIIPVIIIDYLVIVIIVACEGSLYCMSRSRQDCIKLEEVLQSLPKSALLYGPIVCKGFSQ